MQEPVLQTWESIGNECKRTQNGLKSSRKVKLRTEIFMKLLSSKYTFFYKFIFILIWLVGFGIGTKEIIFMHPFYDAKWLQYTGVWLGIALLIYFITGSVKQVQLDPDKKQLIVSNFIKSTTINLAEIIDVNGSKFLSPRLVWIMLNKKSVFGEKIVFMPAHRPSRSIGVHPLVMELRKEFGVDS